MPALTTKLESVARLVHTIRGEKVLLAADLAALYGVATKALNQAVKRNSDRFPADFHVPAHSTGVECLEVTNCDLKKFCARHAVTRCDLKRPRWCALSALRFHRARRCDAL